MREGSLELDFYIRWYYNPRCRLITAIKQLGDNMSTTFIENGKKIEDETRLLQLEEQLNIIVTLFENGELGEALAKVFIAMEDDMPMSTYSVNNLLGLIIMGATDARGFRQWEAVDREVKPDNKRNPRHSILVPIMKPIYPRQYLTDKSGNKIPLIGRNGKQIKSKGKLLWKVRQYRSGWKVVPMWDISETTGEPLEIKDDNDNAYYLDNLPMIEVAKHLGVDVMPYSGENSGAYGWYSSSTKVIGMGVKDIQVWLHELIHLADDRLGNLVEKGN
jgi:hypothetical protein